MNPSTVGTVEAWQEWNAATRQCGDQLVTEVLKRDDYPGTDSGWESLVAFDTRIKAQRGKPVRPVPVEEIRSRVPAHCWINGKPRGLDDLDDAPAVDTAVTWVSEWNSLHQPSKGLLFAGPTGTGKTSVAAAIAVDCGEPYQAGFWTVGRLLEQVKSEFSRDSGATLRSVKEKPLLVLDELGRERETDFNIDTVRELIEARYDAGLATVVTSNMTPEQLRVHVGERVWSRLYEMVEVVPVFGADRRLSA